MLEAARSAAARAVAWVNTEPDWKSLGRMALHVVHSHDPSDRRSAIRRIWPFPGVPAVAAVTSSSTSLHTGNMVLRSCCTVLAAPTHVARRIGSGDMPSQTQTPCDCCFFPKLGRWEAFSGRRVGKSSYGPPRC
jgi:hypothetical protein